MSCCDIDDLLGNVGPSWVRQTQLVKEGPELHAILESFGEGIRVRGCPGLFVACYFLNFIIVRSHVGGFLLVISHHIHGEDIFFFKTVEELVVTNSMVSSVRHHIHILPLLTMIRVGIPTHIFPFSFLKPQILRIDFLLELVP